MVKYSRQWFLHWRSDQPDLLIDALRRHCRQVEEPAPGDVLAYIFGRAAGHCGILVEPGLLIHAFAPAGRVEIIETRALASRLDSCWSAFDDQDNVLTQEALACL